MGTGDGADGKFERRGGLRAPVSFKVSYVSIDDLVESYTEDISRGGMFVRTDDPLPMGDVVVVDVSLPDGGPSYHAFARVAHVIGDEALSEGKVPGMGLEFLDLGETPLANDIARFIASSGHDDPVPPPPAGLTGTVLIVDDDDALRERAAAIVADAGHRVVTAKNGMDAIRKAVQSPPDLIVSDVNMPALDGWQFIRLVRARKALADVPVIFLTTSLSDDERLKGYQAGVNDYIYKPYHDDELALHIQRTIEQARAYPGRTNTLRGQLAHVSIGRLLSLLAAEKREGTLLLVRRDEIATAHLRDGQVVSVDVPDAQADLDGPDRLFWLLDWLHGRFEFTPSEVTDVDTVELSTPHALMRHARLHEEPPTSP